MGLQNGVQCMASLKNLSTTGLMKILRHFMEKNATNNQRPTIDFDINYLFLNKTRVGDSIKMKVEKIIAILISFAKCGVICNPVSDPEERHHSK